MAQMTMKELLDSTVEYYSANTNRRCVKSLKSGAQRCFYNPDAAGLSGISDGCAIGRFMTSEQQRRGDDEGVSNVSDVESLADAYSDIVPEALRHFPIKFLGGIQVLHDSEDHWNEEGLTEPGEQWVRVIEKRWGIGE